MDTSSRRSARILVSVTPEMKERLRRLAKERVWSLSQATYQVILAGLEAMKETNDDDTDK